MTYADYNATAESDGEDHVYVERPDKHGVWQHHTRIAQHGMDKVIKDGGYMHQQDGWVDTVRLLPNWGKDDGSVTIVDGEKLPWGSTL
jgi:hypothetical protein